MEEEKENAQACGLSSEVVVGRVRGSAIERALGMPDIAVEEEREIEMLKKEIGLLEK